LKYREIAPRKELAPLVRCFWQLAGNDANPIVERVVPDGCCEIVLNRACVALVQSGPLRSC